MAEPSYKKYFGSEFFTVQKLSRVPKGFPADWPDGDLLKYKDYCTMGQIAAEHVGNDDLLERVVDVFAASVPLNKFIQKAMYEMI